MNIFSKRLDLLYCHSSTFDYVSALTASWILCRRQHTASKRSSEVYSNIQRQSMICANVMKSSPLIILTLQGLSLRVKAVLIRPLESGEGYNTAPNSFHKQVSVDKQN